MLAAKAKYHYWGGIVFHFSFFLKSFSIFLGGRLSSWVKIRLHTKNQLPRLPGSGLKCNHMWCGGGGFLPIIIHTNQVVLFRVFGWVVAI